jgi:hypothetical protein
MSALLNAAVAVSLFMAGHAQQPLPAPVGLRVEMLLESAAPTLVVGTATPRFSFVSCNSRSSCTTWLYQLYLGRAWPGVRKACCTTHEPPTMAQSSSLTHPRSGHTRVRTVKLKCFWTLGAHAARDNVSRLRAMLHQLHACVLELNKCSRSTIHLCIPVACPSSHYAHAAAALDVGSSRSWGQRNSVRMQPSLPITSICLKCVNLPHTTTTHHQTTTHHLTPPHAFTR